MLHGCSGQGGKQSEQNDIESCVEATLLGNSEQDSVAEAINAEAKRAEIDSYFRGIVQGGFNGAILVEQKGVLLYKNVYGISNLQRRDSLKPNSTFQLASISKMFTAVAALRLAEEGRLSLTDTIQQYIKDFPYNGITIADLLSHRSGLPNYLYCFDKKLRDGSEPPSNETLVDWFTEADPQIPMLGSVNRGFQYNNTNYAVLARIVEEVTQKPFDKYMRKTLFQPLGMHSTYIDCTAPDSLLATKTTGYEGRRVHNRDFFDGVYGDKGAFSTLDDMLRWYHALRSGCLLSESMLDSAFTPRSLESRSTHNYGYGFRMMTNLYDMHEVHYVYHGGLWNGYCTMFWMDYENDFVIIILSNRKNSYAYDARSLIKILEGGTLEHYERKINGRR